MADRFQIEEVSRFLESEILGELKAENCCEVLEWSLQSGQQATERAARRLALQQFEIVAETSGFLAINEDLLGALLPAHRPQRVGRDGGCDPLDEGRK